MNDPKRQEIKDRIAASQARQQAHPSPVAERADQRPDEPTDDITSFIREHPLLTIGAGLAAGVLIASLFPSARRAARKGGTQAAAAGAVGADMLMSAVEDLLGTASDVGHAGAEKVDDLGDTISDVAKSARRDASYKAAVTGDQARIATRETGKTISRALGRLTR